MRQRTLMVAWLSVAVAAGCRPTTDTGQVNKGTQEAVKATHDYVHSEQVAAIQSVLTEIGRKIDVLFTKAERAIGALEDASQSRRQALHDKVAWPGEQLDQVECASKSTWGDAKASFERSRGELKNRIEQVRQWLSAKVVL